MRTAAILILCLGLYGCVTVATTAGFVLAGISIYCVSTTEAGKQLARDTVTDGQAVIACPAKEVPHE